jgi:hypothetical protein
VIWRSRPAGWLVVGTLVAAAAYELALALGAGSLGPEPGDDVAGSGVVQVLAFLAMLGAAVLAPLYRSRFWPPALFAPAAAAFLVAFYFTFDPYFAPGLRRYSDGNVAVSGIAAVVAIALANGVLTRQWPRVGRWTTSGVVLLVFLTTLLAGDGH